MSVRVSLTGGLGNQMFQVAVALFCGINEEIILHSNLGLPRSHSGKYPDVYDWDMPGFITLTECRKASLFEKKASGYLLNKSANANSAVMRYWPSFLERVVGISLFFETTSLRPVFGNVGPGHDVRLKGTSPSILIGYFQSAEFLNEKYVFNTLFSLRPKSLDIETTNLIQRAKELGPTIIHIRRGDYVGSGLGTLGEKYFGTALERLSTNSNGRETWVFSNDIPEARELLKKQNLTQFRFIEESQQITPVNTMHLMRHGSSFIISNSSFSWWAAALALDRNAPVVAPAPWFKTLESPQGIYPKNWITTPSEFE
jgi:hypothetical protein